jgi:hypothetical protein
VYGYRLGEVTLPELAEPKENTVVKRIELSPLDRMPQLISLGPVITTAVCPRPDTGDAATTLASIIKRVASKHPKADPKSLDRLGSFVKKWLEGNLTPLGSDSDTSVERWLSKCTYAECRKTELLSKYMLVMNRFDKKYGRAKCFIKKEHYATYKHCRGIYSRSDEFKCFVGPYFKLIEEEVYKLPQFIKHVPVADRPSYIREYLIGIGATEATDYTAFESQFNAELMELVEMQLYRYMTQFLPDREQFLRHLKVLLERQRCDFKTIGVEIDTARLSGEMCTSLGNGFSNLMFALFVAHERGCSGVRIVVEGDDGLMKKCGPNLEVEDFARIGLTIKLEKHDDMETASFCGLVFDSEELINITDPRVALASFGWGDAQYTLAKKTKLEALLRCKALSLAHSFPGCPIISELAWMGLRNTRHVKKKAMVKIVDTIQNQWVRDRVLLPLRDEKNIVRKQAGPRSRAIVESRYGISVAAQVGIETYLNQKCDLTPLHNNWIDMNMPYEWCAFASEYVRFVSKKQIKTEPFSIVGGQLKCIMNLENVSFELNSPLLFN